MCRVKGSLSRNPSRAHGVQKRRQLRLCQLDGIDLRRRREMARFGSCLGGADGRLDQRPRRG